MELFTQNARYHALQGQIHPHFIYGTLETIRMTALQNKDEDAASMIFSLSALIRYSISISSKAVTLRDELEIAGHYLKIQKIRLNDRIDYRFQVEEELLSLSFPSFILQPILENAVIYGISSTLDDCSLTVTATETPDSIVISVANTGVLITQDRLLEINLLLSGEQLSETFKGKNNGLALNNIKERLAIFFDGRASVRLELEENQTVTRITIKKDGDKTPPRFTGGEETICFPPENLDNS
jgi:sensor histidine kinase YesM